MSSAHPMLPSTSNFDAIIGLAHRAKSLMHRAEMVWLCQLADVAPAGAGVEVGVYCGASLIAWSLVRLGRGEAVGIDNWTYRDIAQLKEICAANLLEAKSPAQLRDLESLVAVQDFNYGSIAFLLIDGDHTSPAIEQDIEAWTPKVMAGGVVVFHDYGRHKNDCHVTQAVDSWQKRVGWERLGLEETLIGFQRP